MDWRTRYLDRVPSIAITDCHSDPTAPASGTRLCRKAPCSPRRQVHRPLGTRQPERDFVSRTAAAANGPVHLDFRAKWPPHRPKSNSPALSAPDRPAEKNFPSLPRADHFSLLGLPPVRLALQNSASSFTSLRWSHTKPKEWSPDVHPWFGGVLTNGGLEREILERADAFIAAGLDEVELLPKPWSYPQPMLRVPAHRLPKVLRPARLGSRRSPQPGRTARSRMRIEAKDSLPSASSNGCQSLSRRPHHGRRGRAHVPGHVVLAREQPCGMLISNGLSTMGFAFPAAIGAALLDRTQPVVAFTEMEV